MSDAIPSRAAARSRYDATVREVKHWHQPPDKRQDVDIVVVDLDYATGAMWWLVDEGTVSAGDRYCITVTANRCGRFEDTA